MSEPFFNVKIQKQNEDFGRFTIEPLPQGFGHTIGNSLRRILLSFIPGTAVSKVKIKGVRHQFSTITGLQEDIVEFLLNLKKIQFRLEGEKQAKLTLVKSGPGKITASDITLASGVSIANPDEYLGSLASKNAKIEMTIWIESGVGYIPSEERTISEIGVIPVDSLFSPVRRVNFTVEETRVGRATNYDKLTLEVWTNGAFNPKEVLEEAARILVSYFTHIFDPKEPVKKEPGAGGLSKTVLQTLVEELDLSVRLTNALKKGGFTTLSDFVGKKRKDLEKVRNLGAKSIGLIEKKLKAKGVVLES